MIEIIEQHRKKYPLMTEQDIVKLMFQNEFGCGHFVKDEKASLSLIEDEYINRKPASTLFEDIGNGYVRMYLSALDDDSFDAEIINRLFILSANYSSGTAKSLKEKLSLLDESDYIREYISKGCPMVSHSESYRKAYSPAYRVIRKELASMYFLLLTLKNKANHKKITVAFDGRAAAGKTTAAEIAERVLGCSVIHADDFFLPFEMRTKERLLEPGGNIHYERLKNEVIDNLDNEAIKYGKFNCSLGKITESITVKRNQILIVEGAYSSHPYFGDAYDIKVFFDIDNTLQAERILKRNGAEMLKKFQDIWIPMENKYISEFNIDKASGFYLKAK